MEGLVVLVPGQDHDYYPMTITKGRAVHNSDYNIWVEYHGDDYLEDGDEVQEVWLVK